MPIFIRVEQNATDNARVLFMHYAPDELTEEEKKDGFIIESIPDADRIEGKAAHLFYNKTTSLFFYEYVDIPLTAEQEVKILKTENATFKDQLKATQDTLDFLLLG